MVQKKLLIADEQAILEPIISAQETGTQFCDYFQSAVSCSMLIQVVSDSE